MNFGKMKTGFRPRIFLLALLLVAIPFTVFAAGGNGGVLRATLKNGLRVVIVKNTLAPVVTTEVNYLVGSNEAPAGFPGMAHAQEHMMFRGSPGLTQDQLANIMTSMGGMMNADTQQTITQYFFTVPAEDLEVALHVQSIRMRGCLDDQKLWEKERGAIEQEVAQDLSNPQYVFYMKLLKAMFKGTPYEHDALGTKASFDKTTGAMLKKFYDTWYAPNNAILVIVGNVQPEKTLDTVKRLFEDIPAKKIPARPKINLSPVKPETLNLTTDLPYGLAIISFRMPGTDSPDYAAAQVLSDVLSSKRGKLYGLVPRGKALYAGFQMNGLPGAGLGFALAVFPKGADAKILVKDIGNSLADAVKNGVSADLVKAAKRHELTSAERQRNSVTGLAMLWSQALALEGRNSPDEDVAAMEKVTVADVNRVAKIYLNPAHAITTILTPQPSGKPKSSKGFGGAESFAPKNPKPVKLPEWAETALSRLSVPESATNPVVTVLPNGLKLIVQPENVSNTVNIFGEIKNSPKMETPKGKEGVDQVLGSLFEFGTTSLDRVAFQKALDEIGAEVSAGTSFSAHALSENFEETVKLLADNELHPALPARYFKVMQMQTARTVAGILQSPAFLTQQAIKKALYPKGDPSLRHATPQTVASLTLKDVKNYYKKVFRPDLTTIVVIGKIQPETAKAVIEKYFGNWKAVGPKPKTELPPVPLNQASQAAVPDTSRVQDEVTLTETLGLLRSNSDYYALELGNHVLGGGFYSTRYYRDLRQKAGLVYYVASSFDLGQTRSTYTVRYGCNPPNVSRAQDIVVKNLKAMASAPVTPEELHNAKAMLLRQIPLRESSVSSIAWGILSRCDQNLPLDEPTLAAKKYLTLTAKEVQAAFKKWIRPNALVRVTMGPAPK